MNNRVFDSALKRISVGIGIFMLIGQVVLFQLHIHLDKKCHSEYIATHTKFELDSDLTSHYFSPEKGAHKSCDFCEMFFNTKLSAVKSFTLLFTAVSFFDCPPYLTRFETSRLFNANLRGPPSLSNI
ncbi:MAG: hypothetical protein AAGI07_10785 [Bacteroidota bacterium]